MGAAGGNGLRLRCGAVLLIEVARPRAGAGLLSWIQQRDHFLDTMAPAVGRPLRQVAWTNRTANDRAESGP